MLFYTQITGTLEQEYGNGYLQITLPIGVPFHPDLQPEILTDANNETKNA